MKLEINNIDIDNAEAERDGEKPPQCICPIAQALRRTFPKNDFQVFDGHILVNGRMISHSAESSDFAAEWDEGLMDACVLEFPEIEFALKP